LIGGGVGALNGDDDKEILVIGAAGIVERWNKNYNNQKKDNNK
jgi:hypothetical protein